MATGTFSQILGPTLETERSSPRKTGRCERNPQTDPADGHRQSLVASSENSWRIEDAGHNNIGANRLSDLRTLPRQPSQTWKTFLRNQLGQIVAVDFFTVPTIRLRVLFVFLVLEHRRREVLHFNVTEHPTSAWVAQQIVEAFADRETPRYLVRDRDGVYGTEVRTRLKSMGIAEVLTAPQSPWQNAYAERLIGSIRRECLNHFIILNSRHLKKTLVAYFRYYHRSRPHLALSKQCPIERQVMEDGAIVAIAEVGGLHHRYERIAA